MTDARRAALRRQAARIVEATAERDRLIVELRSEGELSLRELGSLAGLTAQGVQNVVDRSSR